MRIPKKDFQRFRNACEKLCQLFGLQHFGHVFTHKFIPGTWAQVYVSEGNSAVFTLTTAMLKEDAAGYPGPELLAVHEVAHLLTWALVKQAGKANRDKVMEEWEFQATRTENAIKSLLTPKQLRDLGE